MQLDTYFEHLSPTEIRLKGHRIWLEDILYEYLYNAQSPEELQHRFPSLSLAQIYASILYYLQNKEAVEEYLLAWLSHGDAMRQKQQRNPSPVILKLQQKKAECDAQKEQTEAA